jgi:uncharacterized membrane protein YedE/YeeE
MKNFVIKGSKYLLAGTVFGVVMAKSEAASWYRIREMFLFANFHMYGIIGTAVVIGAGVIFLIKKYNLRDIKGNPIVLKKNAPAIWRYLLGGTIFGLGWALSGACPGPMFVSLGYGFPVMAIVIFGAFLGTFIYGLLRDKLPH